MRNGMSVWRRRGTALAFGVAIGAVLLSLVLGDLPDVGVRTAPFKKLGNLYRSFAAEELAVVLFHA